MSNNETLADIACEMRTYFQAQKRNGYPEHRPWHQVLSDWADRIEAAHARKSGDTAAMREALEAVKDWFDGDMDGDDVSEMDAMLEKVDAALAAPPRNCDVGAAKEQAKRFATLCNKYYDDENPCDKRCQLAQMDFIHGFPRCQAFWAQMPYEEGGAE